ncbi:MAG: hypothetical protein Q8K15_02700 [Candidatus Omnitrophota bacterium]|nr:hypothetical protein [Candidatus Omnitrophota bacterium]
MKLNRMLGALVLFITITTFIAFAQEPGDSVPAASTMPADLAPAPIKNEVDTQWAWGEVTSLDGQAKTLSLKYFDYETDQEKELVLAVDEKTAYEDIKSFDEIKIKDTLSIDYAVGPENKNVAKNISLERPDALAAVPQHPALSEEPVRASAQPPAANALQPITQPEAADESSVEVLVSPAPEPIPATQGQTQ